MSRRGCQLGVKGWTAVTDALEVVTSLKKLNGSDLYGAIRAGGLNSIELSRTELVLWATRFLERSASTLTVLDVR